MAPRVSAASAASAAWTRVRRALWRACVGLVPSDVPPDGYLHMMAGLVGFPGVSP